MRARLAESMGRLHPERILSSVAAGVVAGIVTVVVETSLAALIFSGELSPHVSRGIGLALFGAVVLGVIGALTSSFPGVVTVPQDSPAAILAPMVATIAASLAVSVSAEQMFVTVAVAIALTSLLAGLVFLALGSLRLGGLVRYVPYPVVGGFLAGTGWLLFRGGMGVMAGVPLALSELPLLLRSDIWIRWVPGLIFALLLLMVLRRYSHFLIIPGALLGAVGLFYVVLWLMGTPVAAASDQGWLLGPFPGGRLWQPLRPSMLGQVEWSAVFQQAGSMATVLIVSVISLLLNASGLELIMQQDVDLDRELRSTGLANLVAGLGGGPVGYASVSLSALGHRLGANHRLVGVVSSVLCAVTLFFGAQMLSFFPKPVLGGLLLFLGLSFLVEWLYDAWFKLAWFDYLTIVLILAAIAFLGVLPGVGLGITMAVILFVINYSRVAIVRHTLSGATRRSTVDRPRVYRQLLREKGHWIYILELQGYLFFGTANRLLERVRERIDDARLAKPRFVVLDFRRVQGLDASALLSFERIRQLAEARSFTLVFTHLSPSAERQLEDFLRCDDAAVCLTFPDLDHGLEWCEDRLIEVFREVGIAAEPRTVKEQLERFLPHADQFSSLRAFLSSGAEAAPDPISSESIDVAALETYLERTEAAAGEYLLRQGEVPAGLYFIEHGGATARLDVEGGRVARLRRMGPGTVVGEVGLYTGAAATASVVVDQPSIVYCLSTDRLKQMECEDPALAAALHKFIAQLLGERLKDATSTVEALLH